MAPLAVRCSQVGTGTTVRPVEMRLRYVLWGRTGDLTGLLLFLYDGELDEDPAHAILETLDEPPQRLYGPGPAAGAYATAAEVGVDLWMPAPKAEEVGGHREDWAALSAWTRRFISLQPPFPR